MAAVNVNPPNAIDMRDGSKKRSVTIISSNLCGGGVIACAGLGRSLHDYYSVQLIGSVFGAKPWSGLDDLPFEVIKVPGKQFPGYVASMNSILRQIRGDVVIAHQLRLPSFGVGMLNRLRRGTPCALYIDDDDLALTRPGRSNRFRDRVRTPTGDIYTRMAFRLRHKADATFCGSDYFAGKYQGTTVRLGRDASLFDPEACDRESVRAQLDIGPSQFVVGFLGNPRPHVGFEDLVAAMNSLGDPDIHLLVAPQGGLDEFAREQFKKARFSYQIVENAPSSKIPALLAASDLVVVPQRAGDVSQGQLPARLVEGMAMAKPIITTRIADIPDLLDGVAVFIPERDPKAIAQAIIYVRDHPNEASTMARSARQIFLDELSLQSMGNILRPAIDHLMSPKSETP